MYLYAQPYAASTTFARAPYCCSTREPACFNSSRISSFLSVGIDPLMSSLTMPPDGFDRFLRFLTLALLSADASAFTMTFGIWNAFRCLLATSEHHDQEFYYTGQAQLWTYPVRPKQHKSSRMLTACNQTSATQSCAAVLATPGTSHTCVGCFLLLGSATFSQKVLRHVNLYKVTVSQVDMKLLDVSMNAPSLTALILAGTDAVRLLETLQGLLIQAEEQSACAIQQQCRYFSWQLEVR